MENDEWMGNLSVLPFSITVKIMNQKSTGKQLKKSTHSFFKINLFFAEPKITPILIDDKNQENKGKI